jgi:hypothetical protein
VKFATKKSLLAVKISCLKESKQFATLAFLRG